MNDTTQDGQSRMPPDADDVFAPVIELVKQARDAIEAKKMGVAVAALDSVECALPWLRNFAARASVNATSTRTSGPLQMSFKYDVAREMVLALCFDISEIAEHVLGYPISEPGDGFRIVAAVRKMACLARMIDQLSAGAYHADRILTEDEMTMVDLANRMQRYVASLDRDDDSRRQAALCLAASRAIAREVGDLESEASV